MIVREHRTSENEIRWRNGEIWLCRSVSAAGRWRNEGSQVRSESLVSSPPPQLSLGIKEFGEQLAQKFSCVRISENQWNGRRFIYVCIDGIYSIAALSVAEAQIWSLHLEEYISLPLFDGEAAPVAIRLNPESFGFLLHETSGHRLEGDDYSKPIAWCTPWTELNFDVWDTAGKPGWLGHLPFDDCETPAQNVRLLSGVTGEQQFMSAGTGNLRASSHEFHAIVRQRNLEVILREPSSPPSRPTIILEGISRGSTLGDSFELVTSRQVYLDETGQRFRLPQLRVAGGINCVRSLTAYGENQAFHPAGGCSKAGQAQLPVTFFAPCAWAPINAFQISVLS